MLAVHLVSVVALSMALGSSLALGSCAADDGMSQADSGPALADATTECAAAAGAAPDWLLGAQETDLRQLTGIDPTPSGVTLSERSTEANRTATRALLQARLESLGYSAMLDDYGTGKNVFAELAATVDTTDTIVVGAHFDTVPGSPGANDNATGVAMVLAAARYAAELDCRSQNIVFVFFDEEEIGLIGSDQFAQLLGRPEFGATITAVHTIDQNGWDQDGDRAFELERPDGNLFSAYTSAQQLAGASMPIHETTTGFTDHVSFRTYGFTAIGVTEEYVNGDTTPHYHLSSDRYETVDREYLASTTRIMLTMLRSSVTISGTALRSPGPTRANASLGERYQAAARHPRDVSPKRPHGCRSRTNEIRR
jgi:Zn-dependent M28 family amino/carboxypeptidase